MRNRRARGHYRPARAAGEPANGPSIPPRPFRVRRPFNGRRRRAERGPASLRMSVHGAPPARFIPGARLRADPSHRLMLIRRSENKCAWPESILGEWSPRACELRGHIAERWEGRVWRTMCCSRVWCMMEFEWCEDAIQGTSWMGLVSILTRLQRYIKRRYCLNGCLG